MTSLRAREVKHEIQDRRRLLMLATANLLCTEGAQAQTIEEFVTEVHLNRPLANKDLVKAYIDVSLECQDHYRAKGNVERAQFVRVFQPNYSQILNRINAAEATQPNANINGVIRAYIVEELAKASTKMQN